MVDLSIAEGKLTLHVRDADKLWAFKSSLEIPFVISRVSGQTRKWHAAGITALGYRAQMSPAS